MATAADLGVDGNGILSGQFKNRWRVILQGFAGSADPIRVNCISVDRPKGEMPEIRQDRYNSTAYSAGKHEWQPITMVVQTDMGQTVHKSIADQINLQQGIIANIPQPRLPAAVGGAIYKFATILEGLDGDDTVVESWVLEGCWIMNYDWDNYDYSANEFLAVTLVIRFDAARQAINGIKVNTTGGAGVSGI